LPWSAAGQTAKPLEACADSAVHCAQKHYTSSEKGVPNDIQNELLCRLLMHLSVKFYAVLLLAFLLQRISNFLQKGATMMIATSFATFRASQDRKRQKDRNQCLRFTLRFLAAMLRRPMAVKYSTALCRALMTSAVANSALEWGLGPLYLSDFGYARTKNIWPYMRQEVHLIVHHV